MRRILPAIIGILIILLVGFTYLLHSKNASAAQATHVVVSEVQLGGAGSGTTTNDFIELYNPTSSNVSLDGMRLGERTSGTASANIVVFASTDKVPAHGFFLWCNSSLAGSLSCDSSSSGTLANDNSMALIDGSLAAGAVVDAVSFGTPGTTFGEGTSLTAPAGGTSVERKANSASTSTTMGVGGIDEFGGNGEDTNNNASDFVGRATPQPQNNSSSLEPVAASPTVTPTVEPTSAPTTVPSVTPTTIPSPTVTSSPTPTVTPIMSPTPTPPTPTPKVIVHGPIFTCFLNYRSIRFFNFHILIPFVTCMHV